MLDKVIEIGILFDFYGSLLTGKQQETIQLYYYQDLSLSEIAERLEISRQGVYDHLHRAEEALRDYEEKLGLINRYKLLKNELDELEKAIKEYQIENTVKSNLIKRVEKIKKHL
ncbi:MAG: YlxM family DNA-binding protein [Halanaerobiaceae bacterium]|nr:YlxM family DNA-binding protein [Halanaerobiaceae bacterium]